MFITFDGIIVYDLIRKIYAKLYINKGILFSNNGSEKLRDCAPIVKPLIKYLLGENGNGTNFSKIIKCKFNNGAQKAFKRIKNILSSENIPSFTLTVKSLST